MTNNQYDNVISQRSQSVIIETNKVLKNTYLLLSLTLIFSAITAGYSMVIGGQSINPILTFFVYMGLLFGIQATRNSPIALVLTFALTGFLGFTMGGILNYYIATFSNGAEMIMMSLGATGAIFLALSIIAMNPEKDFSKFSNFLGIGSLICLFAIVINLFLQLPAVHLALSVMIAFIAGGMILWQTNQIIHGGEKNYITATVALYISIINIFMTILQFFAMFSGRRD
jgi:modulator of FtsH protease